ncbi:TetR family transcriptional regulator [Gordonia araii NBRC 100433]|uniref:TetR family transcriptional regulator n=1 Tax=Gordonia araii NBRC 100433 TaxID=1073574 RepID=G7H1R4_9ACTN|nr:TetR/AcrR family transcriptional regulator [Gordonia araii]NNG99219.1 TetR/AcrR family transcriptional regulator [Gordonia araii NBRC 100433]GAB09789.1 TetR family transcriptional regulator [Gordonia araii NBRC 100433]
MARPAEPGRNALLEAGVDVAAERGLVGLSVNAVVDAAGMAKGSFYHHFANRREYLVALHRAYHDELNAEVNAAIGGMDPGPERLRTGIETFLDACRRTKATKALLAQSRTAADLLPEVVRRNADAADLMRPDIALIGWSDPKAVAAMTVAMVAETALTELYDDEKRSDLRAAIYAMLTAGPVDGSVK